MAPGGRRKKEAAAAAAAAPRPGPAVQKKKGARGGTCTLQSQDEAPPNTKEACSGGTSSSMPVMRAAAGRPLAPPLALACGWFDLGQGSSVGYFPAALGRLAHLMPSLLRLPWQQREVVVMGRRVQQPRKVCYYADTSALSYTYSGLTLQPLPWGDGPVVQIKAAVEELLTREAPPPAGGAQPFNSCLMNLFEDGRRYLGWHSDSERCFGDNPEIVSVSFGAARDFQLREIAGARRRVTVLLSPGDVLIMRGTTQRHWQHGVPQRAKTTSPRVSLTFRNMLPHGSGGSAGRRDGSHDKAGSGAG